jgi:phage shock protein A
MIKETECDDGVRFGVNYGDYTIHLIGAVQQHQCTIEAANTQIAALQAANTTLESQVATLSASIASLVARLEALEAR